MSVNFTETKKCLKCGESKPLNEFYSHSQMKDGHLNKCKQCVKSDNRKNYIANIQYYRNYDKRRQRENIQRIFNHTYNGLVARSSRNYPSQRTYQVFGKPFLSKDDWNKWCAAHIGQFMKLYKAYVSSGYKRTLRPSLDRINSDDGYTVDNIQWLTVHDNCVKYNK